MRALVIDRPGHCRLTEVDRPTPQPGELLLRTRRVGLCGTDLSTYRGKNPLVSYPRIPGHEVAATVEAIGPGVQDGPKPGAAVTVVPYTACGECPACRRGRSNACRSNQTLGVQRDGTLVDYFTAPREKVLVADQLGLAELCLVEPLSVGAHAVRRGRIAANDSVAVFGCGAVGLGAVAASAARGARTIAIDIDRTKLKLAQLAGAAAVVDAATEDVHEILGGLTGGDGPDVIIEAIGLPETFRQAVEEVAFTGRVVYIGYVKRPVTYETRLFVQKELDILGSRNAAAEDFLAVIRMLQSGRFPTAEAVSAVVGLEEAAAALEEWNKRPGAFTKILVDLDAE